MFTNIDILCMFRLNRVHSKMSQNINLNERCEEEAENDDNSSFSFIDNGDDDDANDAKMAALEKEFAQKLTALEGKCQKEIAEFKAYFEEKLKNAAEQKAQVEKNEKEQNMEKNGQKMEQFAKKQTTTTHLNVKAHLLGIGASSTLRTLRNVQQSSTSSFSASSTTPSFISSLDFCVQFINHHLNTTINWASHADDAYFNRLDPECRATQFLAGWATLHLIDFAYGILKGDLPFQISFRLGNKESTIDVSTVALMGCAQFQMEWTELIQLQLRQYQFTEMDYEAFKYLTFFDDGIYQTCTDTEEPQLAHYREQVNQIYSQVLQSWSEIRNAGGGPTIPLLLDSLHKFGQLAAKCVEQLRERVQARDKHGLLANVPELLEEVLKNGVPAQNLF